MKRIVCIDIDGVIGDSDATFRKYFLKEFGIWVPRRKVNIFSYEKVLGKTEKEMEKLWKKFTKERWWLKIKLTPYAKESITKLKNYYRIYLLTARPYELVGEQTYEWLNLKKIPYDKVIFIKERDGERKLYKLIELNLNPEFYVEDRFDFAEEAARAGIKTFLFDYPWNRITNNTPPLLIRVKGWKEVLNYVL